jgi:cell division protein FtsW (lipid II flippase)
MPVQEALGLALIIVLAALLVLTAVYMGVASSFNHVRHPRNEFAFHLGSWVWIVAGVALVGSAAILQTRTWFIATVLMVTFSLVAAPAFGYSGPGYLWDAVAPLLILQSFFGPVLVLVSARVAFGIAARRSRAVKA